jgi:hypothetical protein
MTLMQDARRGKKQDDYKPFTLHITYFGEFVLLFYDVYYIYELN